MKYSNNFIHLLILGFFVITISALATGKGNRESEQTRASVSNSSGALQVTDIKPKPVEENEIEIILVGDVMLGRTVMKKTYEKEDYKYPFLKIASELSSADIVFANLENPVIEDCPFTEKSMIFCSTPEMLEGLNYSGINVVNLANNHINNHGKQGIKDTIEYLNVAGIDYSGRGELLIKEVEGIRFGFLGFNYTFGDSSEKIEKDLELINLSDTKVDQLIVGVHWGQEYRDKPNEFQKQLAKKMIESGADIISGHHPHWIQESGEVNGKPVFYSLGNFVFDQMWSEKTRTGLIVKLKIDAKEIRSIEEKTVYMENWAQPRVSTEEASLSR